jgi:LmbE family N-acetylglucosaminyl deacetylase
MLLDCDTLPVRNVLVVVPHPDDESLGCGGLIASLAVTGRLFHTVFVTDGGASHPGSREWPRHRVAAQREKEAAAALAHLGIGDHPRTFLRLRDAAMPELFSSDWRVAVANLSMIIATFLPELVLLPWRRDPHRDHRDSWRLYMEARVASAISPMSLEYAVWLEEFGKAADFPSDDEAEYVVFNVAAALPSKLAAIGAHLSQTGDLIDDDPGGFRLTTATIARLTGPHEGYWRPLR